RSRSSVVKLRRPGRQIDCCGSGANVFEHMRRLLHRDSSLSPVRTGRKKNGSDQVGNVIEELRQRDWAGSEVNLRYRWIRARSQAFGVHRSRSKKDKRKAAGKILLASWLQTQKVLTKSYHSCSSSAECLVTQSLMS